MRTRRMPAILVVDPDDARREQVGGWLTERGSVVMTCPGPGEPDYLCLGGRGHICPLAGAVDAVVLRMYFGSDAVGRGTPGWALLVYYRKLGRPVVALVDDRDALHPIPGPRVSVVPGSAGREEILDAVERALAENHDGERRAG